MIILQSKVLEMRKMSEKKEKRWIRPPTFAIICQDCARQDMEYTVCGGCKDYEEYKKTGEPNRF